jgi:anti-sigma regulatory factor (Ser/Thr protein kinase)
MAVDVSRRFPAEPSASGDARAFVRDALQPWVPAERLDDIVLAVSELVTNAIRYVGRPLDVRVQSDGSVRVGVVDASKVEPVKRLPLPDDVDGRGLHIVEDVCDRWGVHLVEEGKCVWCEVDLDRASEPD